MKVNTYRTEIDDNRLNVLVKEKSIDYKKNDDCFDNSDFIYKLMTDVFRLDKMAEEYVYMIAFDVHQHLIGVFQISHGTCKETPLSPREVLIKALLCGACNIVLVHNHPSKSITPSRTDKNTTKIIQESCSLIGINLIDHIIIGDGYYSMCEKNML